MADAHPYRLPDGQWGALTIGATSAQPLPGEPLTIEARSGKRWTARVQEIVGTLVRTESAPARQESETMPCYRLGCEGTWTYRGQAIAPLRTDQEPLDRMCAPCRKTLEANRE